MIHFCLKKGRRQFSSNYFVAGQHLSSNAPIAELSPYKIETFAPNNLLETDYPLERGGDGQTIYQGKGWLGAAWRPVSLWKEADGYWLDVTEIGCLWIASDGATIYLHSRQTSNSAWLSEVILGPALTLALALHGTYCLHAGAVTMGNQVAAFIGESGWGKSTLAACLGDRSQELTSFEEVSSLKRVSDDILPITLQTKGVNAFPHFPQLKLPPDQQPSVGLRQRLPLTAVYLLSPPPTQNSEISIQPLTPHEAVLALMRHTVASKLFDNQLLTQHLRFATAVAKQIPVRRLIYPRRWDVLTAVEQTIISDLQAQ